MQHVTGGGALLDGVFKDEMVLGGEESCNSIIL